MSNFKEAEILAIAKNVSSDYVKKFIKSEPTATYAELTDPQYEPRLVEFFTKVIAEVFAGAAGAHISAQFPEVIEAAAADAVTSAHVDEHETEDVNDFSPSK